MCAHGPARKKGKIVRKIELKKNSYIAPFVSGIIKDSAAKWHGLPLKRQRPTHFDTKEFFMPKTLFQRIVFTFIMALIMVYGMIVYNVALNTGGVTDATFYMALHELPIMMPIAFVLEFFVVEKLATRLAFSFMRPTDRPALITYAISLMIVCLMCPTMSLIATFLFKEPSFGTWIQTFGCNMPMALCWQLLYCGPLTRLIFRTLFRRQLKAESPAPAAKEA